MAGLMGARPHGTARVPVRRQSRTTAQRNDPLEGEVGRFRHPAEAMRAGMALVTEDRKRLGMFAEPGRAARTSRSARFTKPRGWG